MTERKYNPYSPDYLEDEFKIGKLSKDARQLAKEAEAFLRGRPTLKDMLAAKALAGARLYLPILATAASLGMSRCMYSASTKTIRESSPAYPCLPLVPIPFKYK